MKRYVPIVVISCLTALAAGCKSRDARQASQALEEQGAAGPYLGENGTAYLQPEDSRFILGLLRKARIPFAVPPGESGSASISGDLYHTINSNFDKPFAGVTGSDQNGEYLAASAESDADVERLAAILRAVGAVERDGQSAPGSGGTVKQRSARVGCASGPALPAPICTTQVTHVVKLRPEHAAFVAGMIDRASLPLTDVRLYHSIKTDGTGAQAGVTGTKANGEPGSYSATTADEAAQIVALLEAATVPAEPAQFGDVKYTNHETTVSCVREANGLACSVKIEY